MKRLAKDLKIGDNITVAGKPCKVLEHEVSDIGKHGKRKVRIVIKTPDDQKLVIIRPEDYPYETS